MKTILKLSVLTLILIVIACSGSDDSTPPCTEQTWYQDADGDTFGNTSVTQSSCTQPTGYVSNGTDCDDTDAFSYPGATDICGDGIDNNCDGIVDENCVEICDDGIDNDGDGLVDCEDSDCNGNVACPTLYADVDGDGYGDPNNIINGGITDNTDCDDFDTSINPGAIDVPDNGIDENCDGQTDYTFYADNDGDGYGDPSNSLVASCPAPCNDETQMTIPNGYVFNKLDCNDTDANINPFIAENTTDGIDNNCNGNTDVIYYYQDIDGDGFGDANDSGTTVDFAGSSQNNTDCDDNNANVFFGATEIADGIDNNCNGLVDEF